MDAAPPVEAGKPHICVVTETYPPEVNGVALTLARLLNGLRKRGHTVSLVRPRHKRGERTDNAADFPMTLVPSVPLPGYDGLHLGLPANRLLPKLGTTAPGRRVRCDRGPSRPLGGARRAAPRYSRVQRLSHQFPQLQPALSPGLSRPGRRGLSTTDE